MTLLRHSLKRHHLMYRGGHAAGTTLKVFDESCCSCVLSQTTIVRLKTFLNCDDSHEELHIPGVDYKLCAAASSSSTAQSEALNSTLEDVYGFRFISSSGWTSIMAAAWEGGDALFLLTLIGLPDNISTALFFFFPGSQKPERRGELYHQ
ncbi:hypothetical protein JOB18_020818 [Solea senegalensis]|uniref:Uncharacterized protein n=1 Tax=Solea senegalensis TaxID=28829 RepID=A0AAV6QZU2_SOLSE|nr:hypothetical protein JOB18_020818 [Solea senegalensis]